MGGCCGHGGHSGPAAAAAAPPRTPQPQQYACRPVSPAPLPEKLIEYTKKAQLRLENGEGVIPCELCGELHGNVRGKEMYFCSVGHVEARDAEA